MYKLCIRLEVFHFRYLESLFPWITPIFVHKLPVGKFWWFLKFNLNLHGWAVSITKCCPRAVFSNADRYTRQMPFCLSPGVSLPALVLHFKQWFCLLKGKECDWETSTKHNLIHHANTLYKAIIHNLLHFNYDPLHNSMELSLHNHSCPHFDTTNL